MLFAFLSLNVNAQIAIGPKVGVNIATWGGDDTEDLEGLGSVIGLQFGAAAEIAVNEMFAIQPELLFFQKGFSVEFEEDILEETLKSETTAKLNYLEIPILAKIMFGAEEGPKFFATVGPSFGFGLGGEIESKVTFGGETETDTEDIDFEEDMITKLDIGVSVGAGAQFPVGPGNLFVDVRYLLGLNSTDDSEDNSDVKNRGIGISAGFLFPIGGE
jgi:outer membrane protein with beta-barrel domain